LVSATASLYWSPALTRTKSKDRPACHGPGIAEALHFCLAIGDGLSNGATRRLAEMAALGRQIPFSGGSPMIVTMSYWFTS
jgi:hypothetical protein